MTLEKLQGKLERNYPLRNLNTWRIGGPADIVYWPETAEGLISGWRLAKEENLPVWIVGRGSNLLFPDEGLPGMVVVTTQLKGITWEGSCVRVEAGYSLARLAQQAGEKGLRGLEFARGIPGTVGGAVVMNAGAHGGEIAERLTWVKALDPNGEVAAWPKEVLTFGYRESSLSRGYWIVEAEFRLVPGDREHSLQLMKDNLSRRNETQPLEYPNAGSVFRNPPGDSAGRLIEHAGWKGKRVGGAEVSEKHANFILNRGEATAQDVLNLINAIQEDVEKKFGIKLKTEVKYFSARG